jgi:hypothetical protein
MVSSDQRERPSNHEGGLTGDATLTRATTTTPPWFDGRRCAAAHHEGLVRIAMKRAYESRGLRE